MELIKAYKSTVCSCWQILNDSRSKLMTEPLFFTGELDVNYGINTWNQSEQKIKPISKKVFTIGFHGCSF